MPDENNHTNSVTFATKKPVEQGIIAYLGLGANLGDRQESLRTALHKLAEQPTIQIGAVSSVYETAPVGVTDQPLFLNLTASIETTLTPQDLLDVLLHIENQLGRVRTLRWGPRVIDIDLLLYGTQQVSLPELTVPHPRLRERAFVLVPLAEIAPDLVLPGDEIKAAKFLDFLSCEGNIRRVGTV